MQSLLTDYFHHRPADDIGGAMPPHLEAQLRLVPPGGTAKRNADPSWDGDYERPPKRHRGSDTWAACIYRRFWEERGLDLPRAMFLGLCGYLSAILQWNYDIPVAAFDSFICEYRRFENVHLSTSVQSYHQWLQDQTLPLVSHMGTTILDACNLRALADENPYTFRFVQESLEIIGREKSLRDQRLQESSLTRPSEHRSRHLSQTRVEPSERATGLRGQQTSTSPQVPPAPPDVAMAPYATVLAQFKSPATNDPDGSQWHTEKGLRNALRLRDKDELLAWLIQDWVIDVYTEYCVVELDIRRAKEEHLQLAKETIPPAAKRASAKFLINSAVMALESSSPRFLDDRVDKSNWNTEDHDVRFIVRLVHKGRSPGHWWEQQTQPATTEELCTTAYRLQCWLRYCHRLSSARSCSSQRQRASAHQWYTHLRAARNARALSGSHGDLRHNRKQNRRLSSSLLVFVDQCAGGSLKREAASSTRNDVKCTSIAPNDVKVATSTSFFSASEGIKRVGGAITIPVVPRPGVGSTMEQDAKKLELLSDTGIQLHNDGNVHDRFGNPAGGRPPAHAQAARRRVEFDAEDDRHLREWVARSQVQELKLEAKVFRDLELVNPRHSAQSWQARWKKISRDPIPTAPADYRDSTATCDGSTPPCDTSSRQGSVPAQVFHTPSPSAEPGTQDGQNAHADGRVDWSLPAMPTYYLPLSRATPGQPKGIEWLKVTGRDRFIAQQAYILAKWNVTAEHAGTCVLVPKVWSNLDPVVSLLENFNFDVFSCLDDTRLTYSMFDHSTHWVRAATWFKKWPRTGLEFDNFLGSGPFQPMEGSHLCHHGHCINPHHATYEDGKTNQDRKACHNTARGMRLMGLEIPRSCVKHRDEPCLLQHAALTPFEAYLVQFSVVCKARHLEAIEVTPPDDHPYPTFETRLPVSFKPAAITLDPAHVTTEPPSLTIVDSRPLFYCSYCSLITTFRSLTGYWAHIRDGHPLVPKQARLSDIVSAGRSWQAYHRSNPGRGGDYKEATQRQVEQTKEENFDWGVVLSWKLAYARKRKYGKPSGPDPSPPDTSEKGASEARGSGSRSRVGGTAKTAGDQTGQELRYEC